MAKYLFEAAYTHTGLQGLLKEGGSGRVKAVQDAIKNLDGKLEAFYFTFGESDVVLIADLPDNTAASAFALMVVSTGSEKVKTTVLITPEEVDKATKKGISYRAPGK